MTKMAFSLTFLPPPSTADRQEEMKGNGDNWHLMRVIENVSNRLPSPFPPRPQGLLFSFHRLPTGCETVRQTFAVWSTLIN
jgi:hypothetical protein